MRALVLAAAAAAVCVAFAGGADAQPLDPARRVAVVSAYEPEWIALQTMVEGRTDTVEHGVRFITGRIEGREVVLFLSGVGMVNAAMTTQMALDRFAVSEIVFSGIAGGVDPSLTIGDVVVPERWGSYFNVHLARETNGTYSVPDFMHKDFPNFGMIFPQPETVRRDGIEVPDHIFWFEVDRNLLAAAQEAAADVTLTTCDAARKCLSAAPEVVVGGNGVSGSAFVDNAAFREYTFATFGARVLDMESAAVAQVAYTNGVPFIAFRSLSDLAGGGEGENELPLFFELAAGNSAALVRAFLAHTAKP